ncbi:MAG: PilZ domain-containing protein [Bacteroidota bacterium]
MFKTPQDVFKPGSNLIIRYSDTIGELKECVGTVKAIIRGTKEKKLFIDLESKEIAKKIIPGTELTVSFQDYEGQKHQFGTYVIEKKTDESEPLILANPIEVDYTSFRRFIRADVTLPFRYTLNNRSDEGKVANLSGCGLYAIVDLNSAFEVGKIINFEFELPERSKPMCLSGRIVRVEIVGNPVMHGIAIDFEFINIYDQTEIAVYVTKLQHQRGIL